MQVAVLGSTESWYFKDLSRAAVDRHELMPLPFNRLWGSVGGAKGVASAEVQLSEFDAVIVRTMPAGSLEQVVFRMDALARLESQGIPVLNPPKALEAAVDKYLGLVRLQEAGLPVPRTIVCQHPQEAVAAFEELGRDVVLKPLFGAEGRGITRLNDADLAYRACQMLSQLGAVLYLQEFLPHEGNDLRVLVLGDRVWGMRRSNGQDWRTNISRGGRGERAELTPAEIELARASARAIGATFAGVDLLTASGGEPHVLEVNAVPGWRALASVHEADVAAEVLAHLEELRENRP